MGWVAWASLAATLLAFVVSRGQPTQLAPMGFVMLLGWVGQRGAHLALGAEHRRVLPLYEFGLLLFVAGLVIAEVGRLDFRAAAWWKGAIFAAVLAQACLWIAYPPAAPLTERWPFLVALNLLGFLQLAIAAAASIRARFMA
jgi:hypothetical protein